MAQPHKDQKFQQVVTMPTELKPLEKMVLVRVMRLNALVHALVTGVFVGLGILIATNWLVLKGGEIVGPHLALLGQFFVGYEVSFTGSLVGFGYGFVSGFLIGYFVAIIYNRLADFREKKLASSEGEKHQATPP